MLLALSLAVLAQVPPAPLPEPVTNNAVAGLGLRGRSCLFSFMGLDGSLSWSGIQRRAWRCDLSGQHWEAIEPVPGVGRIAATAQALDGKIYLFGGYSMDAAGHETTSASLDIYDPVSDQYSAGAPIPVPVDDAVSGVWRDRLIYLVSGWSKDHNVADVQVYDPALNRWSSATPIPGAPVFGHAGGIVGDCIVYCEGVSSEVGRKPKFQLNPASYRGDIDPEHPERVRWSRLPPHPGPAGYRRAAGPLGGGLVFSGGTDNPYNYNGVGYDGRPSLPSARMFRYLPGPSRWQSAPDGPASMDHRGLVPLDGALYQVGGMVAGPKATSAVRRLEF